MKLRLVQFNLGPDKREVAETIANKVVPVIRAQPGCERAEFFGETESGDYGIIVLWESRKAADTAALIISPILGPLVAEAKATGESRRLFDIYEVK